jgi:hypothetical protein
MYSLLTMPVQVLASKKVWKFENLALVPYGNKSERRVNVRRPLNSKYVSTPWMMLAFHQVVF